MLHLASCPGEYPETHPKIIDVQICKMRRKLTPIGISIETVWGEGYRLAGDARQIIDEFRNREMEEAA